MRKTHNYRRLFASDLLKEDKKTKNIELNNERANQLNQLEKLVVEKPAKIIKEKVKPTEKETQEEPPQELKRSTRINKGKKPSRFDE